MDKFPYHSEYLKKKVNRTYYSALYTGNHEVINSPQHLPLLEIEKNKKDGRLLRRRRVNHSFYRNKTRPAVMNWVSQIFSRKMHIKSDYSKDFSKFLNNSTLGRKPKDFEQFLFCCFVVDALVQGDASVIVDSTESGQPFLRSIDANSLVYWEVDDETGQYTRVDIEKMVPTVEGKEIKNKIVRSIYQATDTGFDFSKFELEAPSMKINIQTEAYRQVGETVSVAYLPKDENLPRLPIVTMDSESWVADIAELCQELHSIRSIYNNILQIQGHLQRYIVSNAEGSAVLESSESSLWHLKIGDSAGQLDAIDPIAHEKAIEKIDTEIKEVVSRRARVMATGSKQSQGMDSIKADSITMRLTVENFLEALVPTLDKVLRVVSVFSGNEYLNPDPIVSVRKDDPLDEIDISQVIALLDLLEPELRESEDMKARVYAQILSNKVFDFEPEEVAKITKEVASAREQERQTNQTQDREVG